MYKERECKGARDDDGGGEERIKFGAADRLEVTCACEFQLPPSTERHPSPTQESIIQHSGRRMIASTSSMLRLQRTVFVGKVVHEISVVRVHFRNILFSQRAYHDLVTLPGNKPVISSGPPGYSAVSGHRVTVFGCTGFLGRYLVSKLGACARGASVHLLTLLLQEKWARRLSCRTGRRTRRGCSSLWGIWVRLSAWSVVASAFPGCWCGLCAYFRCTL